MSPKALLLAALQFDREHIPAWHTGTGACPGAQGDPADTWRDKAHLCLCWDVSAWRFEPRIGLESSQFSEQKFAGLMEMKTQNPSLRVSLDK